MRHDAHRAPATLLALLTALPLLGAAQTLPATLPATTAPATKPVLVPPPGTAPLVIGNRKFLVFAGDEPWVRAAAEAARPATRPSTLPSDLLEVLVARKDQLVAGIARDTGMDPAEVERGLVGPGDQSLKGRLEKFEATRICAIFLAAPRDRVGAAMEAGWETPTLRYNRAMREPVFNRPLAMADDETSPLALVPLIPDPKLSDADRTAWLARQLSSFDAVLQNTRSSVGMKLVQDSLMGLIGTGAFKGLKFGPDQEWLNAGVTGVLHAKYSAAIIGVGRRQFIAMKVTDRGWAVRASSVNLLHPMDPGTMVPAAVPEYGAALTRKSIAIMDQVMLRAGDDVVVKILAQVREKKPADGAALAAIVKDVSGVDVEPWLAGGAMPPPAH